MTAIKRIVRSEGFRDYVSIILAMLMIVLVCVVLALSIQTQRRNHAINKISHASEQAEAASEEVRDFVRDIKAQTNERNNNTGASDAAIAEGLANIKQIQITLDELVKENK